MLLAHAVGIPLYAKRLLNEPRKKCKEYVICRLMSNPYTNGIAPMDWQYGGILGPAPPVLLVRND